MSESDILPPDELLGKSPLDKPLRELTEDDIAQLTREDCRRYLKEKGMRRPSWNKSQAIQQVISLKKLLEPTPDSESGGRSKRVPKTANVGLSGPVNETLPFKEKDSGNPSCAGDLPCHIATADNESLPRNMDVSDMPAGQMTIFYCGKVNVYNGVPADKAREIMYLAASPLQLPQDAPYDGCMAVQSSACQRQGAGTKAGPEPNVALLPAPQPVRTSESCRNYGEVNRSFLDDNSEGPGSRKASVQRYLEKRKDRFKSKRKVETATSAGFDVYLNHHIGSQLNECSSGVNACSPTQIRPPNTPTRCGSAENHVNRSAGFHGKIKD